MDFVAIDFETANHRSDSACQLAVVQVEGGQIVGEKSWLIRPRRLYFSPQCIAVHGILPEHVKDQPEWDQLWAEIHSMIEGRIVVAHNAGFDLRVLNTTLLAYDLACPEIEYSCTRLIARRAWPGRSGYGLKPTADALGLSFRHHDALEDARVCAIIAIEAAKLHQSPSFEVLEEKLSITRGRLRYGKMTGPRCIRRSRSKTQSLFEDGPSSRNFRRDGWPESSEASKRRRQSTEAIVQSAVGSLPLKNKGVVLNGSLMGLSREDAVLFLERLGAKVQSHINLETHYLIVGHTIDTADQQPFSIPEREAEVQERRSQGQPIRILTQRQLLALLPGGLEIARSIAER